jgi:hypothetical protein
MSVIRGINLVPCRLPPKEDSQEPLRNHPGPVFVIRLRLLRPGYIRMKFCYSGLPGNILQAIWIARHQKELFSLRGHKLHDRG